MERKLLKFLRLDHIPNAGIRENTKLTDVVNGVLPATSKDSSMKGVAN